MNVKCVYTAFNSPIQDLKAKLDSNYRNEDVIFWYLVKYCSKFAQQPEFAGYFYRNYESRYFLPARLLNVEADEGAEKYLNFGDVIVTEFLDSASRVDYIAFHTERYLREAIEFIADHYEKFSSDTLIVLIRALYRKSRDKVAMFDSLSDVPIMERVWGVSGRRAISTLHSKVIQAFYRDF